MLVPRAAVRPLVILTVLALVGCERHRVVRPRDQDWIPRFNGIKRAHRESDSVPGAGFAMFVNGESTASFAGWADAERRIAITDSTVFDAAPLSEPVTALVALTAARLGRLSLDEPVLDLARGWRQPLGGDAAGLTVRRVLSHAAVATRGGQRFEYPGGGYPLLRRALATRLGIPVAEMYQNYLFGVFGRFDAMKSPEAVERAIAYDVRGEAVGSVRCTGDDPNALCLSTRDAYSILRDYIGPPLVMTFHEVDSAAVPRTWAQIPGFDVGGSSPNYGLGHFVIRSPEGDVIMFNGGRDLRRRGLSRVEPHQAGSDPHRCKLTTCAPSRGASRRRVGADGRLHSATGLLNLTRRRARCRRSRPSGAGDGDDRA